MNLKRYRSKIERMYTDKATVLRGKGVKTDYGETRPEKPGEPGTVVYESQPCYLSQKALGSNNQTTVQNNVLYETKLFIAPELDIQQGDLITVEKGSRVRNYTAGEPFVYPTHQEISLERKEKA